MTYQKPPEGWSDFGVLAGQEAPYGAFVSSEQGEDGLPLWERLVRLDELPVGRRWIRSALEDVQPKVPATIDPDFDEHAYGQLEDRMLNQREPRT